MKLSIFTTYTDPEKRNDPWKEALNCFNDIADEVIVTGSDWPEEFTWSQIGKYFQQGLIESTGDWNIRMDIDYFFHEKDVNKLYDYLRKYNDFPVLCFPQYQFFTLNRYQLKTRLCVAVNKKFKNRIKLDGGGDLCLATFDGKLVTPKQIPNLPIPIYQYDSTFRTMEIIKNDRARFARAWNREFGSFGSRGSDNPDDCYDAWFSDIQKKYPKHVHKIDLNNHPKYIIEKLNSLEENQFGYSAFGLKNDWSSNLKNRIQGIKAKYIDIKLNNKSKNYLSG